MLFLPPLRRESAGFYAAYRPGSQSDSNSQAVCVLTRVVLGRENYRDLKPRFQHFFRRVAVNLSIRSCTLLAFGTGGRSRNCFGRISMRSFLGSPLVVVGESLKLARNRSVGHGLDSAEQALCYY